MLANGFRIHAQSVAGIATALYVEEIDILFDCGISFKDSYKKSHVFITHGHVDHIKDIVGHAARRQLMNMKPANYYLPHNIVEDVKDIICSFRRIQEADIKANLIPVHANQYIEINKTTVVRSYPTFHRVTSFGYIVYRRTKRLKQEYIGLHAEELVRLKSSAVEICETEMIPEIGYTGDTRFKLFEKVNNYARDDYGNDFLRVKLLITEATFVDGEKGVQEAISKGHIHLQQIIEKAHLFDSVPCVVLTHFSARYSANYLMQCWDSLPNTLRSKLLFYYPS